MEMTKDIARAVQLIKAGRVVGFSTGTSYGLAVDALQGHALQRLRNLKQRPGEKPFTVFIDDSLWENFLTLTADEARLLQKLPNAALTLLVSPKPSLRHLARDGRIGLRVIDHPLMAALARQANVPLTATSANVSGQEPGITAAAVLAAFPPTTDETTFDLSLGCVLDGGTIPENPPTTIARLDGDAVVIVRQGVLSQGAIEAALEA